VIRVLGIHTLDVFAVFKERLLDYLVYLSVLREGSVTLLRSIIERMPLRCWDSSCSNRSSRFISLVLYDND
jgi:hypothetical protein